MVKTPNKHFVFATGEVLKSRMEYFEIKKVKRGLLLFLTLDRQNILHYRWGCAGGATRDFLAKPIGTKLGEVKGHLEVKKFS